MYSSIFGWMGYVEKKWTHPWTNHQHFPIHFTQLPAPAFVAGYHLPGAVATNTGRAPSPHRLRWGIWPTACSSFFTLLEFSETCFLNDLVEICWNRCPSLKNRERKKTRQENPKVWAAKAAPGIHQVTHLQEMLRLWSLWAAEHSSPTKNGWFPEFPRFNFVLCPSFEPQFWTPTSSNDSNDPKSHPQPSPAPGPCPPLPHPSGHCQARGPRATEKSCLEQSKIHHMPRGKKSLGWSWTRHRCKLEWQHGSDQGKFISVQPWVNTRV